MDPYKMVIAVTNQKGGCAKTTTSVNLATVLAEGNRKYGIPASKVLLIDLDPQGNVSTSFGIDKSKLKKTVSDVLMNDLGDELPLMDEFIINSIKRQINKEKTGQKLINLIKNNFIFSKYIILFIRYLQSIIVPYKLELSQILITKKNSKFYHEFKPVYKILTSNN